MAEKEKKYSLWLRPFGEIAFSIEQRIKKLSEQYGTHCFEPHVTLLGKLTFPLTELIQLTDTLAGSQNPFDIVLTKAGYRDRFYQSLFVHIQESEELMHAREVAEKLFEVNDDEPYMPHISLMYGDLSREEKERILNIMGREFHLRFSVNSLLLIETTGTPDEWKKVHTSEFGGQIPAE